MPKLGLEVSTTSLASTARSPKESKAWQGLVFEHCCASALKVDLSLESEENAEKDEKDCFRMFLWVGVPGAWKAKPLKPEQNVQLNLLPL